VNASAGAGQNNGQAAMGGSNKSGSSGRSTPSLSGGSGSDPAPGKLFVGGLSWQTSSDKLKEYFNMFGTVTDVLIMKDPVTQVSRNILYFHLLYVVYYFYMMMYLHNPPAFRVYSYHFVIYLLHSCKTAGFVALFAFSFSTSLPAEV